MNKKKLAGRAAAVALTAVTATVLGTSTAAAQTTLADDATDYAYSLDIVGNVLGVDPLTLVHSLNGDLVSDELLSLQEHLPAELTDKISADVLSSKAAAAASESSVKGLDVLDILSADAVNTWCEGGNGGLEVVNGTFLGQAIPENPVPGETIDLSPVAKLALNQQARGSDDSLTVTGLQLTLLPTGGAELVEAQESALSQLDAALGHAPGSTSKTIADLESQLGVPAIPAEGITITIGQANCAEGSAESADADAEGDSEGEGDVASASDESGASKNTAGNNSAVLSDTAGSAPKPSVVAAALPVTG